MADRWSNPSGAHDIERFRVWPAGTDSYDHAELADNWDKLDAIIGIPSTGIWPSSEGLGGGIYGEITSAKAAAIPVGACFPWFRPSTSMAVPEGYVICDGQTVSDHEVLNVTGSFSAPDLRNRFIIGASATTPVGTASADAASANVNITLGAPGPGGVGGLNSVVLTADNLAPHQHAGSVTGWSPPKKTWYQDVGEAGQYEVQKAGPGKTVGQGGGGYGAGRHRHYLNDLAADGGGKPHENRPRWVGLIWIMKVRNAR
jgi:hypothetical protein